MKKLYTLTTIMLLSMSPNLLRPEPGEEAEKSLPAPVTIRDRMLNAWHHLTGRTEQKDTRWLDNAVDQRVDTSVVKVLNKTHRMSMQKLTTEQLKKLSTESEMRAVAPHLTTQQIVQFLTASKPNHGMSNTLINNISASQARAVETALTQQNPAQELRINDTFVAANLSARARTVGQMILENLTLMQLKDA